MGEAAKLPASTALLADSGWLQLPIKNGTNLIVQWGSARCSGSGEDAGIDNNFPVAFPNKAARMVLSHSGHTPTAAGILSFLITGVTGFKAFSSVSKTTDGVSGFFIAIGY